MNGQNRIEFTDLWTRGFSTGFSTGNLSLSPDRLPAGQSREPGIRGPGRRSKVALRRGRVVCGRLAGEFLEAAGKRFGDLSIEKKVILCDLVMQNAATGVDEG